MARLLMLSNEILLEIISYLRSEQSPSLHNSPFIYFPRELKQANRVAAESVKNLYSVALVCNRLYNVAVSVLYNQIPLLTNYDRSLIFVLTLERAPHLSAHIRHVDISVSRGYNPDTIDFYSLFWLPNVHTICIRDFNSWHGWKFDNQDHVRTSPVKILKLLNCGAHEEPLAEVLSWPESLQELWYDANQVEWSGSYEGQDPVEFTCSAVERAMSSQAGCLEKLVFTRRGPDHEGLGYSDLLNVRKYGKLKSFCVNAVFLLGLDPESVRVWEHLPKSLEELDICYDDYMYASITGPEDMTPAWLSGMLDKMVAGRDESDARGGFTPSLERVRLTSLEWSPVYEEDEEDESGSEDSVVTSDFEIDETKAVGYPGSTWRPSLRLRQSFIKAGVSFSIFLHQQRRYRYVVNGGHGFRDNWEDTWDPEREAVDGLYWISR
ncbi:hypothetical protein F5B20DRAFT_560456 [Whalleya microplaca]|nr:hypothetical protein F5B20DRAFT_560456 [Whalleya microplaca]